MRRSVRILIGCCLVVTWLAGDALAGEKSSSESRAGKLVSQALKAEIEGNNAVREAALRKAVQVAPEFAPSRWHLGQVRWNNRWETVAAVQQSVARDKRFQDYGAMRALCQDSAAGHLALASWCRKSKLPEKERAHLLLALRHDPRNAEAMRRLGVRRVGNEFLTTDEFAAHQKKEREEKAAWRKWAPQVTKWRQWIKGPNKQQRAQGWKQLQQLRDPKAVPALENVLARENAQLALEVVEVLGEIPHQRATEALIRAAVQSQWAPVRYAAAQKLANRQPHSYAPQLLSGLQMPIKVGFYAGGDTAAVSFFKETQDGQYHIIRGQTVSRLLTFDQSQASQMFGYSVASRKTREVGATPQDFQRFDQLKRSVESQVRTANGRIASMNRGIGRTLATATGKEYSDDPRVWWTWWSEFNELHSEEKPVYRDIAIGQYDEELVLRSHRQMSCFPAGTPVWTIHGLRPIESVAPGDLVLSQDQDSGELAFQPVIDRTIRPDSPVVQVSLARETIGATRGHPMWVAGRGWRMAKGLEPGWLLHGVNGGTRIEAVEEGKPARAFNLVVDRFHSYFVGNTGVLVHDNVLRKPCDCLTPGLPR